MRVLIVIIFVAFSALAQDDIKAKEALAERARNRMYDGGMDEQSLSVQSNLTEPRTDGSEYTVRNRVLNSTDEEPATDETESGF